MAFSFDASLIEEIRGTISLLIESILCSASIRAFHYGNLRFVTTADIQLSLKEQFGILVYGCGMDGKPPSLWSESIQEVIIKQGYKSLSVAALSIVNDLMTSQINRILEVAKTLLNKSALRGKTLPVSYTHLTLPTIYSV